VWFWQVQLYWSSSNTSSICIKFEISLRYSVFLLPIFPILWYHKIWPNSVPFSFRFSGCLLSVHSYPVTSVFFYGFWLSTYLCGFIVPMLVNIVLLNVILVARSVFHILSRWEEGTIVPSSYLELSSFWLQKIWYYKIQYIYYVKLYAVNLILQTIVVSLLQTSIVHATYYARGAHSFNLSSIRLVSNSYSFEMHII